MAYSDYSATDLAADTAFRQWVLQPDPELERFWTDFLRQHPQQASTVRQAIQVVRQLQQANSPNPQLSADTHSQVDTIWKTLQAQIDGETHPLTPAGRVIPIHPVWGRWVAAASVLLVLGLGWWWSSQRYGTTSAETGQLVVGSADKPLVERVNNTVSPVWVRLSDGSTVQLQPRSRLSYPNRFAAGKREVSLSGEAFFQVTKNPARPFVVYAGETVTRVLGTSFRIRAYEQEKTVSVVVRTGRVSVFSRPDVEGARGQSTPPTTGLLLTPNQRATFHRDSEQLAKDLVEQPLPLPTAVQPVDLVFEDRPVAEVFVALEKLYGLTIAFDAETLSHCPITTTLTHDEGLHQRLGRICRAIGASYEVVDGQIIIQSTGCTP